MSVPGCLICAGKGPFEVANKDLTCALILWGDIQRFPDKLSQPCTSFIQVMHPLILPLLLPPVPPAVVVLTLHRPAQIAQFARLCSFRVGLCPSIPITTTTPPMSVLCSCAV